GQYARAEDTFWELLSVTEPPKPVVEQGIVFYRALLSKGDDLLEAGGLPRAEIEDALGELERSIQNVPR
ncbi:MAG: DUF6483 family protein, partial [Ardenticatenaceae bacterium]